MNAHRNLLAWQACLKLAVSIYKVTKGFPRDELFGLTSQLRRAGVSSAANIAEGYARRGSKEFRRFLGISLGSLAEIDTELVVAKAAGVLEKAEYLALQQQRTEASKATYGLMNGIRRAVK